METAVFKYLLGLAEEHGLLALLFFYVWREFKANKDARKAAEARAKEDREAAERRAREDREAAERRAREDREAFGERAREDREAAERRAREDREANKNDHERLFAEVSGLTADVKVLRDRSDRSNSDS